MKLRARAASDYNDAEVYSINDLLAEIERQRGELDAAKAALKLALRQRAPVEPKTLREFLRAMTRLINARDNATNDAERVQLVQDFVAQHVAELDAAKAEVERLREAFAAGERAGLERAAVHVENHSCVASCCDAQPSGGEAAALADCIRRMTAQEGSGDA